MKYILILFVSFSFYSCGSKCVKSWTFEIPFNIENEHDSYNVNDTIWISSYLDHELTDALTGEKSEFPDFGKHQMGITMVELDGTNAIYSIEKIIFLPIKGNYDFLTFHSEQVLGNAGVYAINFEENYPKYEAKFGMVLKEPGIFFIQVSSIAWTINEDQVAISECKDYLAGFDVKFSNDSDLNFDIFSPLTKPDFYPTEKEEYVKEGFFTFRVEE